MSEKALQRTVKRTQDKSKGEKERFIHFNAEFQRTSSRVKKVFLTNHCKEMEENNRMGNIRVSSNI